MLYFFPSFLLFCQNLKQMWTFKFIYRARAVLSDIKTSQILMCVERKFYQQKFKLKMKYCSKMNRKCWITTNKNKIHDCCPQQHEVHKHLKWCLNNVWESCNSFRTISSKSFMQCGTLHSPRIEIKAALSKQNGLDGK